MSTFSKIFPKFVFVLLLVGAPALAQTPQSPAAPKSPAPEQGASTQQHAQAPDLYYEDDEDDNSDDEDDGSRSARADRPKQNDKNENDIWHEWEYDWRSPLDTGPERRTQTGQYLRQIGLLGLMSPPKGARFYLRRGKNGIAIQCRKDEPTQTCVEAATYLLDYLKGERSRDDYEHKGEPKGQHP